MIAVVPARRLATNAPAMNRPRVVRSPCASRKFDAFKTWSFSRVRQVPSPRTKREFLGNPTVSALARDDPGHCNPCLMGRFALVGGLAEYVNHPARLKERGVPIGRAEGTGNLALPSSSPAESAVTQEDGLDSSSKPSWFAVGWSGGWCLSQASPARVATRVITEGSP